MGKYQNFGEGGSSDSQAKLKALGLPIDMQGLRVLDLGCNAGFFTIECARRGATCVGLEISESLYVEAIDNAKAHGVAQSCKFINGGWADVLGGIDEQFDVILWTSAIHYERNQRRILHQLRNRIKLDGVLLIEGGFVTGLDIGPVVQHVTRGDGSTVFHFSLEYLQSVALNGLFESRVRGASVNQRGDRVNRHVVACYPTKPTLRLIRGVSGIGKSHTATKLARQQGAALIRVDAYFADLDYQRVNGVPATNDIRKALDNFNTGCGVGTRVDLNMQLLVNAGLAGQVAKALVSNLSQHTEYVLEGYLPNIVAQEIRNALPGWKVWDTTLPGVAEMD